MVRVILSMGGWVIVLYVSNLLDSFSLGKGNVFYVA